MIEFENEEFLDLFGEVSELANMFMFDIATMPAEIKDNVLRLAREETEKVYQRLWAKIGPKGIKYD